MTLYPRTPIEPRSTAGTSRRNLLGRLRIGTEITVLDAAIQYDPKEILRVDPLGKVYDAQLRDSNDERVALLLIEKDWVRSLDDQRWSRLEIGVAQLENLRNDSLVKIRHHRLERNANTPSPLYVATDWIDGHTLREEIIKRQRENSPMTWERARFVISSLTDAIDYLLNANPPYLPIPTLLHPEMCRLPRAGANSNRGILDDLGLILFLTDYDKWRSRLPASRMPYLSPEERRGETVDPFSSIYTLGLMLYEITHNHLPSPELVAIEDQRQRRNKLDEESPQIPPAGRDFLARALDPIRQNRYPSLEAFRIELENISGGETPKEFAQPVTDQTNGELQRVDKVVWTSREGNEKKSKQFTSPFITVGSNRDNDIVVDEKGVMPRHLCIWRDAEGIYTATEMEEREQPRQRIPTRLDKIPLSPNFAALLSYDSILEVGHTEIHILSPDVLVRKKKNYVIGAVLTEQSKINAKAGDVLVIPFKIIYQADLTEELWLSCDGMPKNWEVNYSTQSIRELKDNSKDESLRIVLPSVAQSEAKTYALNLRLISSNLRAQIAVKQIFITIIPDYRFECRLIPETVSNNGLLLIGNQGNFTQSFIVRWSDKEGLLNFSPPETRVNVRPESTTEVWYRAKPQRLHIFGREKQYQMAVDVIPEGGIAQSKAGMVVSRALIPAWLLPILTAILLLAVLFAATILKPEFVKAKVESGSTPVAGEPLDLEWQSINGCFYSVSVNGTTREWLNFNGDPQKFQLEQLPAGTIVEVNLRNCLFVAGKPWQMVVADAPTPTPLPTATPLIHAFVVNTTTILLGQTGNLCFAWQTMGDNQVFEIRPVIGAVDPQKHEFCAPIASTFTQSDTIRFGLFTGYSPEILTSKLLDQPVQIWSPVCRVSSAPLNVREGPGITFPERGQLALNDTVTVKAQPFYPFGGVVKDGAAEAWVEILAGENDPRPAWVDFSYLDCTPIRDLLNALPPSSAIPSSPTATPTETPTPTATATPLPPGPQFITKVEPKIINQGGCVMVSWDIQGVKEVYLNGAGQMGTGEFEDCPTEDKKYDWHIKLVDETFKDIQLQVKVNSSGTPGNPPPPITQ